MCAESSFCVPMTPVSESQMLPFTSLVFGDDLLCASKDGRVFQIDDKRYQIKRSLNLHNSWISAMLVTEKYFISGSYDTSICLCTMSELLNCSREPRITRYNVHEDYVMSMCANNDVLISASSDLTVVVSRISMENITVLNQTTVSHSVHCMIWIGDCVFFGRADGVVEKRSSGKINDILASFPVDSCPKCFAFNGKELAVGCLDGTVHYIAPDSCEELRKEKFTSQIVSIDFESTFVIFTSDGTIYRNGEQVAKAESEIVFGLSRGDAYHVASIDASLSYFIDDKIAKRIAPGLGYIKAQRLAHSCQILCKTTCKTVELWNALTLEKEQDFGQCKFREKIKELSKRPNFYFPISFDITTGQVRIVIGNVLPKLYSPIYIQQIRELRKFLNNLIEKNTMIYTANESGKVVWRSPASKALPLWTKYVVDEHYEPNVSPFI